MKTIDLIWAFCLTLMVVVPFGCKEKTEPSGSQVVLGGPYGYQDYAFHYVVAPTKMKISQSETRGKHPVLYLDFDGPIYSDRQGYKIGLQELQEFRQRVGDSYRQQYYEIPPYPVNVLARGITSLLVEAVEDYNENYGAGASLAPIIKVSYWSWDASFYSDSFKGRLDHEQYTRLLSEGLVNTKLPESRGISVRLTEAPSQPRVKLRFVVTLDNGTQLELTEEVEIRKIS